MITIGSLFAGIGGLELGLEWAGLGPTLWQVEKDPFCRRKLAARWPHAKRFERVEDVGATNLLPVGLLCGGFPCQDISSAGRRAGINGAQSGLWHHFARIVGEMRPRWIVVENVRSGARKWIDPVRGALEREGYATLPIPIAASDCGAPHERARVFIIGCRHASDVERELLREQSRRPCGEDRQSAAESPCSIADAHHHARDVHETARRDLSHAQRHSGWSVEPGVDRVVHGFSERVDYERALGNSVVPQCAEVIGHVIRQLMGEP